jgi:TonB family protein
MLEVESSARPAQTSTAESPVELAFVIELPPRFSDFAQNLWALVRPSRPSAYSGAEPLWTDVLIPAHLPGWGLFESLMVHAFVFGVLVGLSRAPAPIQVRYPQPPDHSQLTYYQVADQLPAVESQPAPALKSQKADPLPAPQEIVSLPPAPQNFRQRIVTPEPAPLKSEQRLPNLMAWTPATPSAPLAPGASRTDSLWKMGAEPRVVPPPPKNVSESPSDAALPTRAAVPPAVTAAVAPLSSDTLVLPSRTVVAPTPADVNVASGLGSEALPTSRAADPPVIVAANNNPGNSSSSGPPATAPLIGGGRVIVVGPNPAEPNGAVEIPRGTLNGAFSASPNGKPDASGAPAMVSGGDGAGENGAARNSSDTPAGLVVRGNSTNSSGAPVVVAAGPPKPEPAAAAAPAPRPAKPNIFATRRSVTDLAASAGPTADHAEDQVFHSRRYYSLTLSMPNFNSNSGSWVVRFAIADRTLPDDDLQPPVALVKVDPAYPAELIREGVEGDVTVFATIHADGSVGGVRVLRSVNDRLDEFACAALSNWKFQPATRHGSAVELDAVFQIPFHARRLNY